MRIDGDWETREVYIDGKRLDPRRSQAIWNHSPDGFNWGYSGSGPAQLALAILLRVTDQVTAQRYHQRFKAEVVASWPQADFEVEFDVRGWLRGKIAQDLNAIAVETEAVR